MLVVSFTKKKTANIILFAKKKTLIYYGETKYNLQIIKKKKKHKIFKKVLYLQQQSNKFRTHPHFQEEHQMIYERCCKFTDEELALSNGMWHI
jgi:hypothetical protein